MSSGDEAILLLRLVDADGNASGETLTEGEAEPVVTLPDSKTRTFTATGSGSVILLKPDAVHPVKVLEPIGKNFLASG